jgi:hypothetical protein
MSFETKGGQNRKYAKKNNKSWIENRKSGRRGRWNEEGKLKRGKGKKLIHSGVRRMLYKLFTDNLNVNLKIRLLEHVRK